MDILFPISRWLSSPQILKDMIFEPKELKEQYTSL